MRATIVGAGRIGTALSQMGDAIVVRRGEPIPSEEGPIYVCARNDDLEAVLGATLPQHRKDLVFLQNGMLQSWLEKHGLQDNTQALIYFAVQKLGDKPVDGGGSVVCGPWAETFAQMLQSAGIECTVVDRPTYQRQMVEKLLWNCIFGLLSQRHATTVGDVVDRFSSEVDTLVSELVPLAEKELNIQLEPGVCQRLCDYSKSVADYRGAVKELPWRNGWFLNIQKTPKHVQWLQEVGVDI
ncbi:MAG: ketopantoate reductase family protein [Synechococcus sp.]